MEDVFVDLKIKLQNRCDEYFISCRGLLSEVVEVHAVEALAIYANTVPCMLGPKQRAVLV